ncbi:hypothetical protein uan_033 [Pseudomonas phage UAntarctica]|nr:hypothetical protein uan_033 [Pseudomonas phage UAntarctica]
MGTPHRVIETPVFTFDQLSDEAKKRALEKNYDWNVDHDWWDGVYEDAIMMGEIIGISIDTRRGSKEPAIYFSGFSSQGDGASCECSYSYKVGARKELKSAAPEYYQEGGKGPWIKQEGNVELHRICKELTAVQRKHFYQLEAKVSTYGNYSHSGCTRVTVEHAEERYRDIGDAESDITQLLRDFMDWIYSRLEAEHDYLTSDEQIRDALIANEVEFDMEGNRV